MQEVIRFKKIAPKVVANYAMGDGLAYKVEYW